MRHDYAVMIVKGGGGPEPLRDCCGIIGTVQSCLRGAQAAFILWAKAGPVCDREKIVIPGENRDSCKALSVTRSGVEEVPVEEAYDVERFNLFILYGSADGGEGAVGAVKGLAAQRANCSDVVMVTDNESPPELYSDRDLYGVVCINRIDAADVVRDMVRFTLGPPPGVARPGIRPDCCGEIPPEKSAAELPRRFPQRKGLGPDVYALATFIVAVLVYAVIQSGLYQHEGRPHGARALKQEAVVQETAKQEAAAQETAAEEAVAPGLQTAPKEAFVALDPFVVPLTDERSILRMRIRLQLADASYKSAALYNSSRLRNSIIECVRDQTVRSVACPEGKTRLRQKIMKRVNQAAGKAVFKHIYFTEFVLLGRIVREQEPARARPVAAFGRPGGRTL